MNKRNIALVFVIMSLFAVSLFPDMNLDMNSMSASIGDESFIVQKSPFSLSAEGDLSSDSITSFSETADDDVLFYPDAFNDGTIVFASSGTAGPDEFEAYQKTHQLNDAGPDFYYATGSPDAWVIINFTVPTGDYTIEGFDYAHYSKGAYQDDSADFLFYDWAANDWVDFGDVSVAAGSGVWYNGTVYDPDYWNTQVSLKVNSTDADAQAGAYIDYAELTFYVMTLADSNHYAKSFADVSDYQTLSTASMTTDGDKATLTETGGSGNGWVKSDTFTATDFQDCYLEIRIVSVSYKWALYLLSDGNSYLVQGDSTATGTKKYHLASSNACLAACNQIMFYVIGGSNTVVFDELRIGPATEMGWQHDCSTTEGISSSDGGTIVTDDDAVTLTADGDGSTFIIVADTTATACGISATYYPFFSIDIDSGSGSWTLEQYDGSAYATLQSSVAISAGNKRFNMRALDTYVEKWRVTLTASGVLVSDWLKAYSIANFTVTFASASVSDVSHVESEVLTVSQASGDTYFDIDPVLTIAVATYNVWNVTTNTGVDLTAGNDFNFKPKVGGVTETNLDKTRGNFVTAGTLTDLYIFFYSNEVYSISAIKFWEDSVAPTIEDVWATPYTPSSDDDVTIAVYTADWTDLYTVKANAIDSPTGFSDVDYSLSKNDEDTDLWTYTFGSADLPAGYYVFLVTANDGANTGTELIVFRVVSTAITEPLVIENSGMDVQDSWITFIMQTSWSNASFTIWDNSSVVGHSASEGWYQIAKPTVTGLHNYTVLVNGTHGTSGYSSQTKDYSVSDSWEWLNFKYTVNPVTLSITDLLVQQNNISIVLSGFINTPSLSMTWEAFEHGVSIDTGSFTITASGDYYAIYWEKATPALLKNFTLTITAGASSISVNGYSFVIDGATYSNTYNSAAHFDGDILEENYYPDTANTAFWFTMQTIILLIAIPVLLGIVYFGTKAIKSRKKPNYGNTIYRDKMGPPTIGGN